MAKEITFEAALERLDQIVAALGSGDAPLDRSLALYKEGAELTAFCAQKLEQAKLTVETLFPPAPGVQPDE
ncbi:MAG: exodeoxyribonuclease VII small subunit [Oscillospiraceae bacterium]|nr:exodeoxyribonuclease VII small subunit [Oscillospiraceae bacterium]